MTENVEKFVLYRDLEDGYRWRLHGPGGHTLAASDGGFREKDACKADMRAAMVEHPGAEVVDPTGG